MSADALLAELEAAAAGRFTIVEEPGWKTRGVLWATGGRPEGVMQHHTAPPNPFPMHRLYNGRIKANTGTLENGNLHLIAYGACNFSSGRGSSVVLEENVRPGVPPKDNAKVRGLEDDFNGNPVYWNFENSHPGDGSPLPLAQFDTIVIATIVVNAHFGLNGNNMISHAEHTERKIDPLWNGSNRTAIDQIRDAVRQGEEEDESMLPITATSNKEDIRAIQEMLNAAYGTDLTPTGAWDNPTIDAVKTHTGSATGNPKWSQGLGVGGVQYALIVSDVAAASSNKGDLSRGDTVVLA